MCVIPDDHWSIQNEKDINIPVWPGRLEGWPCPMEIGCCTCCAVPSPATGLPSTCPDSWNGKHGIWWTYSNKTYEVQVEDHSESLVGYLSRLQRDVWITADEQKPWRRLMSILHCTSTCNKIFQHLFVTYRLSDSFPSCITMLTVSAQLLLLILSSLLVSHKLLLSIIQKFTDIYWGDLSLN